jgi:hypothetical protein
MLFQLMQWEQKNIDGNNAFINRYMTICVSHSYEFVYALNVSCTFIVHWYMCRSGNEGLCGKCVFF